MELKLINSAGQAQKDVAISEVVFGRAFNEPLIHQTIVACMANRRSGTKKQKKSIGCTRWWY